jgi:hypothetical protein
MNKTFVWVLAAFIAISPLAFAQKALIENFDGSELAPGFTFNEDDGAVTPQYTNNDTWTLDAFTAWDWDLPKHSIITPTFTGDAFVVECGFGNIIREAGSEWDVVRVAITGLDSDLVVYLGVAAADGQVLPDRAIYFEIQNPDKDNYYIWDSEAFNNGDPVPEPFASFTDTFPESVEVRIEFNGPGQPIDLYYKFDDLDWAHLKQYGNNPPEHTWDGVVAGGTGEYQVYLQPGAGSIPPFTVDLDYLYVTGNIESEFAVDQTRVGDWQLF